MRRMRIAVVTLFPVMIREALAHGVVGRAAQRGLLDVECFDPRDHTADAHRTVDDRPYGGGPGMVLKALPLRSALRAAAASLPPGSRRVYLGADGRRFEQGVAREACNAAGFEEVSQRARLVAGVVLQGDPCLLGRDVDVRVALRAGDSPLGDLAPPVGDL